MSKVKSILIFIRQFIWNVVLTQAYCIIIMFHPQHFDCDIIPLQALSGNVSISLFPPASSQALPPPQSVSQVSHYLVHLRCLLLIWVAWQACCLQARDGIITVHVMKCKSNYVSVTALHNVLLCIVAVASGTISPLQRSVTSVSPNVIWMCTWNWAHGRQIDMPCTST